MEEVFNNNKKEEVKDKEGFELLVKLAEKNQDEGWEIIDARLASVANEKESYEWAKENVSSGSSGLRDLAASIFELTDREIEAADASALFELMRSQDKENPYPSFRAACALAKHADKIGISEENEAEIIKILEKFLGNEDVDSIAKKYLEKLSN